MHRLRALNIAILLVLLPHCLMAAPVRLQFLPMVPVQQTSKLTMEVRESLPILNMSTKGSQVFKYDLVAKNRVPNAKNFQLPGALTLVVKDMFVLLNVNGQEVTFDPRSENAPPSLMQFSRLIDQPINLLVNSHGTLENGPETLDKIYKALPALRQMPLESFFNDMISELFSLYDEELTLGAKIEMQSATGPAFAIPATVIYEIVSITDKEIVAKITGTLEKKTMVLDKTIKGEGDRPQKVEMALTGTMKGTASWQRNNAMVHTLNCDYQYQAQLRSGNMRWTMQMIVSNSVTTNPL